MYWTFLYLSSKIWNQFNNNYILKIENAMNRQAQLQKNIKKKHYFTKLSWGFGKSYRINVKIVHFSSATIYSRELKFLQVIYDSLRSELREIIQKCNFFVFVILNNFGLSSFKFLNHFPYSGHKFPITWSFKAPCVRGWGAL